MLGTLEKSSACILMLGNMAKSSACILKAVIISLPKWWLLLSQMQRRERGRPATHVH